MVVDDDWTLRLALLRILRLTCDLEVEEASDGLHAIRLLERRPFDVLVTDEHMPAGPSGTVLLQMARLRWPEMRRILLTGWSTAELVAADVADEVLDKTMRPWDITETICRLAREARKP